MIPTPDIVITTTTIQTIIFMNMIPGPMVPASIPIIMVHPIMVAITAHPSPLDLAMAVLE